MTWPDDCNVALILCVIDLTLFLAIYRDGN